MFPVGRIISISRKVPETARAFLSSWRLVCLATSMGEIWWGTRGTSPPTFFDGGDIICHVLLFVSLRVCIWRGFKTKCDVYHVLCKDFFMLDVTNRHVDVETEFGVVSLILIFLYIFTSKRIFSILQFSRDRKRLLTASVRHLSSVVYSGPSPGYSSRRGQKTEGGAKNLKGGTF